ncbi:effector-associated constant component EACC1 [Streptomyces tsukubensis]|uniref:Uncharacterized protein n=1 Tax=Streptomyces tsukubensis TaxID=83656 RepID=A0A1V4ADS6_9ACTN|nr:hypothetical protein [Streptomyces tsukubensis]OON82125.1 hypothetical protein B1H18_03465 [Streptomyces tsukubensis]QFR92608.1 hypothetical protein GBW32_05485 [Streptomyces tsukubensis]
MTDIAVRIDRLGPGGQPWDTEEELRSLLRWLRADESLHGTMTVVAAPSAPPVPDAMGAGGFDILQLAVTSGFSAAALAVSILQWKSSTRGSTRVRVRRGDIEVELTGELASDEEVRRVIRLLDGQVPGQVPETAPAAATGTVTAAPTAPADGGDDHPA